MTSKTRKIAKSPTSVQQEELLLALYSLLVRMPLQDLARADQSPEVSSQEPKLQAVSLLEAGLQVYKQLQ